MSLDAVTPETYAKVRLKGDLNKVMETVHGYIEMRNRRSQQGRGFALFASICVQRDNWFELPEFFAFCEKHDLQPIVQGVIGREHLSLNGLTRDQKDELIRLYEKKVPAKWIHMVHYIMESVR